MAYDSTTTDAALAARLRAARRPAVTTHFKPDGDAVGSVLAMTRALFAERFGEDIGRANESVVFVGDSPNDAPMFGFFDRSVGVANVRRYAALLAASPKYVTRSESGAGFAELVGHLLGEG